MTGQILGGQPPSTAAAYQIMIYFAIASSSCSTAMLLACLVTARMFDLRRQALIPRRLILSGLKESKTSDATQVKNEQYTSPLLQSKLHVDGEVSSLPDETSEPLLRVQQFTVESTNMYVPLLEINDGDRIGISGRSGIGKTQLFRALARLDPISPTHKSIDAIDSVSLRGKSWYDMSPAYWRTKVMWVSQDRPTINGTPREFYKQILNYQMHRHSKEHHNNEESILLADTPMTIAANWKLPAKAWDQPWNDLSGGEASRISLAIALVLKPSLLLLDEPFASCDAKTTSKIETTLIERNATVVMVSHDEEQLKRFCSSIVRLS